MPRSRCRALPPLMVCYCTLEFGVLLCSRFALDSLSNQFVVCVVRLLAEFRVVLLIFIVSTVVCLRVPSSVFGVASALCRLLSVLTILSSLSHAFAQPPLAARVSSATKTTSNAYRRSAYLPRRKPTKKTATRAQT